MAGPEDRRGKQEGEELFEDLDEYFAPLEEGEWPEGEQRAEAPVGAPTGPEPADGGGSVEDWELEIEVPAEDELLAEEPGTASQEPGKTEETEEPEPAEEGPVEEEADGEVAAEDSPEAEESDEVEGDRVPAEAVASAPDQEVTAESPADQAEGGLASEDGPPAGAPESETPYHEEEAAEEAALSAEDLFEEPEPVSPQPVDALGAQEPAVTEREGAPEPEAVEAAAEHFATGLRESPEDVERELLAELEAPGDETVTIEPGPPPAPPPTWQEGAEPIEEALGETPPPPVGGRNLFAAFASGILLAIAVIALLVIGKGPFTVFASIVILLGQAELYAVMRTRRLQPATLLGLTCGALMLAGAYLHGPAAILFGVVLSIGLTVPWYMAAPAEGRRNTTVNAGATLFGMIYVPFLASFAILLLTYRGDLGRNVFLVVLGLSVLYDVIAYAVGTLWGNRPLAPTISPNKSWEGAIGATLGVLIVSLAIVPAIEPFTSSRAVGLALVIAIVAPLGDLVESAVKRDLGVKDMGTILPGHGGILDRIDAILFAAPAAYYFLQLSF